MNQAKQESSPSAQTGPTPLAVLIVEDSENDAALMEIEVERAGYRPVCRRVETAEAMTQALRSRKFDLVIADYVMPHFNGLAALALVKEHGLDLPFIIVSGHITDDTAVAAMKAGAHDYVMKDNLARLGPAVERELREAEVRRERRSSEEQLKVESTFRRAIENSVPSGITAVDLEGRQTYVNPAFCAMVGWQESELIGARPPFCYWPTAEVEAITESLGGVVRGDAPASGMELRFQRRGGALLEVLLQVTPLRDAFGTITGWVSSATDITERKHAEVRLAAEHAITRILANAQNLDEAAPGIIQVLLDSLEMEIGTLWWLDDRRQQLDSLFMSSRSLAPELKRFVQESRRRNFGRAEGLPGRVWHERKPLLISHLAEDAEFVRRELAVGAGLLSAVAFPIQTGGDFFGVLEFLSRRSLESEPSILNMMMAVSSEIGQFTHRRSAEAALRKAHDELEMRVQQRTAELKTANIKLHAAISERKRLEHELLDITEKERRRFALDLHDDLGQKLSGIALMTKGLELRLGKSCPGESAEAGRIHELVQQAMNHASDLAHDLATLDFQANSLVDALAGLAVHASKLFGIACKFKAEGPGPVLDPNSVRQLYKIAQESVTNAIKHGKSKKVTIHLTTHPRELELSVQNSGTPFPDLRGREGGMGLRIMQYRTSLLNGTLEIKGQGARGTLVTCTVPFAEAAAEKGSPE